MGIPRFRHVDEVGRRVRGKPLRSSATSTIDGPLTRQVFGSDGAFHYVAPVFLCGIR